MIANEPPVHARQQVPRTVIVYDCVMSALISLAVVRLVLDWVNPSTLENLPANLVLPLIAVVPVAAASTTGLWHLLRRRRQSAG